MLYYEGWCNILRRYQLMAWRVEIDEDKCTGDEECVNVCPVGVLEMQNDKAVVVNEDECLGCESCIEVCPSGAITVTET
jgi:NAD-dependent dihydropyrimidine dehydrogenase PreA subunit